MATAGRQEQWPPQIRQSALGKRVVRICREGPPKSHRVPGTGRSNSAWSRRRTAQPRRKWLTTSCRRGCKTTPTRPELAHFIDHRSVPFGAEDGRKLHFVELRRKLRAVETGVR